MSEKTVFCELGDGRVKRIKFIKECSASDLQCLRSQMIKASEVDPDLKAKLDKSSCVVFQQYCEAISRYVDVENDEEILNNATVKVIFCKLPDVSVLEVQDLPIFNLLEEEQDSAEKMVPLDGVLTRLYPNKRSVDETACDAGPIQKARKTAYQPHPEKFLASKEHEDPRLIMFKDKSSIVSAFVIADRNIEIKVELLMTVSKAALCLLATYYAWDSEYPDKYKVVLEFFDKRLFDRKINNNKVLSKFWTSFSILTD